MIHQVMVTKITTKQGKEIAFSIDSGDQMVFIREEGLYFESEAHHFSDWVSEKIKSGEIIAFVTKQFDLEI
jgi:hypothetical protein